MQTFPSGLSITKIATYTNDNNDTITISKWSGGIGPTDYLATGTGGFSATSRTREGAIDAARRELARLAMEAERAETS